MLSQQHAEYFSIALQKWHDNFDCYDILVMLGENLGLKRFGEPLKIVPYDPLIHEDILGGLIPGEFVQIKICGEGWKTQDNKLLKRALVYKAPSPLK